MDMSWKVGMDRKAVMNQKVGMNRKMGMNRKVGMNRKWYLCKKKKEVLRGAKETGAIWQGLDVHVKLHHQKFTSPCQENNLRTCRVEWRNFLCQPTTMKHEHNIYHFLVYKYSYVCVTGPPLHQRHPSRMQHSSLLPFNWQFCATSPPKLSPTNAHKWQLGEKKKKSQQSTELIIHNMAFVNQYRR